MHMRGDSAVASFEDFANMGKDLFIYFFSPERMQGVFNGCGSKLFNATPERG